MSDRLATTVLALALLFSQSGNLFVAALCPHLSSVAPSCDIRETSSDLAHHHGEPQTQIEPPQVTQSELGDALTTQSPPGACDHCAAHSRTNSTAFPLAQPKVLKRSDAPVPPAFVSAHEAPLTPPAPALFSRAHGPPVTLVSKYILVNTFRI